MTEETYVPTKNFIKYRDRFNVRGCTVDQLRRLTELKALTPQEFEMITGEAF